VTRRKPSQTTTGRLQLLRLFSTLLAIALKMPRTGILSVTAWLQQLRYPSAVLVHNAPDAVYLPHEDVTSTAT
jgi:hypothetical protein